MAEEHSALTLTDATFEKEVTSFSGAVLVDFWASWCGPCLMMAPRVENLAKKYAGNAKVKIAKLDVDANQETSMAFNILSLPTFLAFVDGKPVGSIIGAVNEESLDQLVQAAMAQVKTPVKKAA